MSENTFFLWGCGSGGIFNGVLGEKSCYTWGGGGIRGREEEEGEGLGKSLSSLLG